MREPGVEAHLPERPRDPMTLQQTAQRMLAGVPLREATADFLDDARWVRDQADLAHRVRTEPARVSPEADAYLAALAEHLCARWDVQAPEWVLEPDRFLDRFWFPSNTPALDAHAVAESPAAFRRRNIFIGAQSLMRV